MAFCGQNLPCGHTCSRQDPDNGNHDCYEETCPQSSRFKRPLLKRESSKDPLTGKNVNESFKIVRHADLQRVTEDSPFRSWCPVCDKGLLLVRRLALLDMRLSKMDNCSMCGQQFFYEEDEIAGEKLVSPIPLTLEETVSALDKMLSAEDRTFLQTGDRKERHRAATQLHHSLGRHLRNEWGLWAGSPLARHFREVHGIEHPDDMSGKILDYYVEATIRTRYQRIAEGEDF